MDKLTPEHEALCLAILANRIADVDELTRAEFSQQYPDGRKETIRSPLDDLMMGIVYRTDPDPVPIVVDKDALVRHLLTVPGCSETVTEIDGSHDRVVEVLAEFAPELLSTVTRVPEHVIKTVLAGCKAKGKAKGPDGQDLPGVKMDKPGGRLTVKADKDGIRAVEGLVQAGLISWDGRRAIQPPEAAAS